MIFRSVHHADPNHYRFRNCLFAENYISPSRAGIPTGMKLRFFRELMQSILEGLK